MACGSCGGANRARNDFEVVIEGKSVFRGETVAEARIWIAQNASGARATVRAVPKAQKQ
jgi:hypothetical protein